MMGNKSLLTIILRVVRVGFRVDFGKVDECFYRFGKFSPEVNSCVRYSLFANICSCTCFECPHSSTFSYDELLP